VRDELLSAIAGQILTRSARRVAIDGVDGAGKTHFADELAGVLTGCGAPVVRASVDGFHRPRADRHRRGRNSPEGFFRDSFDYPRLIELLIEPLGPGGTGRFVRAVHDVYAESSVDLAPESAEPGSILVLDGIFTHRPELARIWDYSVWLEVPFAVSIPRVAARDNADHDPLAESNRRYVEGQRLYLAECDPRSQATVVVDNTDLARPVIVD